MNNNVQDHPLKKLNFGVIPINNYRGCLVEKIIGGYKIFGTRVTTEEEVDEVIDKAGVTIKNSISNEY